MCLVLCPPSPTHSSTVSIGHFLVAGPLHRYARSKEWLPFCWAPALRSLWPLSDTGGDGVDFAKAGLGHWSVWWLGVMRVKHKAACQRLRPREMLQGLLEASASPSAASPWGRHMASQGLSSIRAPAAWSCRPQEIESLHHSISCSEIDPQDCSGGGLPWGPKEQGPEAVLFWREKAVGLLMVLGGCRGGRQGAEWPLGLGLLYPARRLQEAQFWEGGLFDGAPHSSGGRLGWDEAPALYPPWTVRLSSSIKIPPSTNQGSLDLLGPGCAIW